MEVRNVPAEEGNSPCWSPVRSLSSTRSRLFRFWGTNLVLTEPSGSAWLLPLQQR